MICTFSGKQAKSCKGPKSPSWYNGGCRCEAALRMHADYTRPRAAERRAARRSGCRACGGERERGHTYCAECAALAESAARARAMAKCRAGVRATATCPMCGSQTSSKSGFCRGCEAKR